MSLEPYARGLLQAAGAHALRLHAETVSPEHLLWALMDDPSAAAHAAVLHAFADPGTIADEVLAVSPGLLVVAFAALVLRASRAASAWKAIVAAGGSIPAVVMTRVVVDGLRDPTSHNLWPFEVVIAVVVGLAVAGTGVLIGMLVARLNPARGSD